jgi:uncharacterized protein (DUF1810 family)
MASRRRRERLPYERSHWMWYVFPQIAGLGLSAQAQRYGIADADEARAYLAHPLLGPRYVECVEALQDLAGHDPVAVFGEVDAVKLRSSLTLFSAVSDRPLFAAALARWYGGERDGKTIAALGGSVAAPISGDGRPSGGVSGGDCAAAEASGAGPRPCRRNDA